MAIQDTLPSPGNPIDQYGENTGSITGPGFASVSLTSDQPVVTNRSNSGIAFRSINRYHNWTLSISYNPMTKISFDTLYSFLLEKQATLEPFFVELPQYGNTSAGTKTVVADASAGSTSLDLNSKASINIGDLFFVTDPMDDVHVKAYKVTRLSSSENKIFFSPVLQRKIEASSMASISFGKPRLRVIMTDDSIKYSIGSNGLYSLSLNLEEALS
jgi:hypothetical protein